MGRTSHPSLVSSLSLVSLPSFVSFLLLIYFSSFLIKKKKIVPHGAKRLKQDAEICTR